MTISMAPITFMKQRLYKKQDQPSFLIRLHQSLPFEEKKRNNLFENDCADREQLEKRKAQRFQQIYKLLGNKCLPP